MNVLILGHSFIANLRDLLEDPEKPHQWEDPTNCRGQVNVFFHGFSGGKVPSLTQSVNDGLFVHYNPRIVIIQVGGNDCSSKTFSKDKFKTDVEALAAACHTRGAAVLFMAVLKRSKPRYCEPDIYNERRAAANDVYRELAKQHAAIGYFRPVNVYHGGCEGSDKVHFNEAGYTAMLRALRKGLSWFVNKLRRQ